MDDAFAAGDWGPWSGGGHLQADTLDELHEFADRLGLRRSWLQTRSGRPWNDHYDLTAQARDDAIALGAVPVSWRQAVRRNRRVRAAHRGQAPP